MKLPKTLRDKRDALAERFGTSHISVGYDACFSDMSEAVQGLVETLEDIKMQMETNLNGHPPYKSENTIDKLLHLLEAVYTGTMESASEGLERWREFVGSEE
jgi:hypothetical protein